MIIVTKSEQLQQGTEDLETQYYDLHGYSVNMELSYVQRPSRINIGARALTYDAGEQGRQEAMDGFKKILAGLKAEGEQIVDFSGDFADMEGGKASAKRKPAQSKSASQGKSEAQDAKE